MDAINRFLNSIPPILQAILLLLLAFVVAWVAQKITVALLRRVHLDERLGTKGVQDTRTGSTSVFVGKLVFVVVFLLFLPGALDQLNMKSVSAPITGMVQSIVGYLPNVVAAGLIIFIGHMIAKLLGQLIEAVLRRLNIDRIQQRWGGGQSAGSSGTSLAHIVGNVVYGLILVVVLIAGLQVLAIHAISDPAIAMLNQVFLFLPRLIVAVVVIGIGVFIANLVSRLLTQVLAGLGADSWPQKLRGDAPAADDGGSHAASTFSLSRTLGTVVRVLIILLFVVEGLNVLQLEILQRVGSAMIGYLPSVLGAAIIGVLGVLAANWVQSMLLRRSGGRTWATAAKVGILLLAAFMALNQLQLSRQIVTIGFMLLLGAAAVAFAISFGIGGRTFAANRLRKLERTLDEPSAPTTGSPTGGVPGQG